MKSKFKIKYRHALGIETVTPKIKIFSGGELHVNFEPPAGCFWDSATIYAQILDANGILALLSIKEILDSQKLDCNISLKMLYIPYARQDRRCATGDAMSLKVFTRLINSLNFYKVFVADPHSDVATNLIDNVVEQFSQADIVRRVASREGKTLVAPDFGATKKIEKVSNKFKLPVIQGFKTRNTSTGELSGFGYYGDVTGKDLLIVDDICDGGGTFLGLAKELYKGGASSVELCVTHGIFSNGVDFLIDNGINKLYTTDSIPQTYLGGSDKFEVFFINN